MSHPFSEMTTQLSESNVLTAPLPNPMMVTKATEINHFHILAFKKMDEAVNAARKVGELLLEVKKTLKHGEFQSWVETYCSFGVRQSQRYMNAALHKDHAIQALTTKSDTTIDLKNGSTKSQGIWMDGKWQPERGVLYLFNENDATYWVMPSDDEIPHFHICKHYGGKPMPTDQFCPRYTVVADVDDPDLTSQFYVGTRFPLFGAQGVAEVLHSYGLQDIKNSLVFSKSVSDGFSRPFGEPKTQHRYWEKVVNNDQG